MVMRELKQRAEYGTATACTVLSGFGPDTFRGFRKNVENAPV